MDILKKEKFETLKLWREALKPPEDYSVKKDQLGMRSSRRVLIWPRSRWQINIEQVI
jgi:hypothetical protein